MDEDNRSINELKEQLQELNKKQNLLENKLEELLEAGSYADEVMDELNNIEGRMDDVEKEVGDIGLCDLDSRISNLEAESTELLSKFGDLEFNNDDNESDIRGFEKNIESINNALDDLENRVSEGEKIKEVWDI